MSKIFGGILLLFIAEISWSQGLSPEEVSAETGGYFGERVQGKLPFLPDTLFPKPRLCTVEDFKFYKDYRKHNVDSYNSKLVKLRSRARKERLKAVAYGAGGLSAGGLLALGKGFTYAGYGAAIFGVVLFGYCSHKIDTHYYWEHNVYAALGGMIAGMALMGLALAHPFVMGILALVASLIYGIDESVDSLKRADDAQREMERARGELARDQERVSELERANCGRDKLR